MKEGINTPLIWKLHKLNTWNQISRWMTLTVISVLLNKIVRSEIKLDKRCILYSNESFIATEFLC